MGPYNAVSDRANLYTSIVDFFCLYQRQRLFLFIPASETFLVYTSVIGMFIKYTSAPVEVSVWLGGKLLKSVYGAFCVQDAVQVE